VRFGKIFDGGFHRVCTSRQGVHAKYPRVRVISQSLAGTVSSGQGLKEVDRNYNLIRLSTVCNAGAAQRVSENFLICLTWEDL
jgi:hypothetical protein